MRLLHKIIFWSHLLAGIIAGLVIFIMSATGVVLMYEHQLVEYAERDVRAITPSDAHGRRLSLDDLIANAREQNPGFQLASVVLRKDATASVAVGFGRNGVTYVDPYTGAVLGTGSKLHDWFHDVLEWHRWLGRDGEGRATSRRHERNGPVRWRKHKSEVAEEKRPNVSRLQASTPFWRAPSSKLPPGL